MACILLWSSAVRVRDSQVYRKMDVTREGIGLSLELREILMSFLAGLKIGAFFSYFFSNKSVLDCKSCLLGTCALSSLFLIDDSF